MAKSVQTNVCSYAEICSSWIVELQLGLYGGGQEFICSNLNFEDTIFGHFLA